MFVPPVSKIILLECLDFVGVNNGVVFHTLSKLS